MHTFPVLGEQQLKSLLLITSISSRWRNIAIGTSKLWTWIVIAAYIVQRGADVGRSIIEAFVERSAHRPISIYLSPPPDTAPFHTEFMQVYETVIPHLGRCSAFCCYQLGNITVPLLFPLVGPMPRLATFVLMGETTIFNSSPVVMFTEPASLTALGNVTIIGIPTAPIPNNPIDQLNIALNGTPSTWSMPLIASSANITSLRLMDGDMLPKSTTSPILLPHLKVLYHWYGTVAPYFDAPVLEEVHWSCSSLTDGDVYFPAVKRLRLSEPSPYHDGCPPRCKFRLPKLTEIVLDDAQEPSTFLRALLLPHTLDAGTDLSEGAEPIKIPFPSLQSVVLEKTGEEDLDVLWGVLGTVLESYQNVRLGYDARETSPKGDENFWGQLREAFGERVFNT